MLLKRIFWVLLVNSDDVKSIGNYGIWVEKVFRVEEKLSSSGLCCCCCCWVEVLVEDEPLVTVPVLDAVFVLDTVFVLDAVFVLVVLMMFMPPVFVPVDVADVEADELDVVDDDPPDVVDDDPPAVDTLTVDPEPPVPTVVMNPLDPELALPVVVLSTRMGLVTTVEVVVTVLVLAVLTPTELTPTISVLTPIEVTPAARVP